MARRYAIASGDWSGHHFDVEAARRSGSDRVFLHGLCTMALCGRGIVEILGCPPERVRRVAVRFASPMPLGEKLDVHLYDGGDHRYVFEAACARSPVITHGRVEVGERTPRSFAWRAGSAIESTASGTWVNLPLGAVPTD